MIDPLDSETPVKRRRSKKKVHFTTREIRDDKENTTRVESITPLQKATPPAKRLARRLVGRMRSASSNLFGARGSIGAVVEEEAQDAGAAEVEEEASDRASEASDRAPRVEALDWAKPLPPTPRAAGAPRRPRGGAPTSPPRRSRRASPPARRRPRARGPGA